MKVLILPPSYYSIYKYYTYYTYYTIGKVTKNDQKRPGYKKIQAGYKLFVTVNSLRFRCYRARLQSYKEIPQTCAFFVLLRYRYSSAMLCYVIYYYNNYLIL